MKPIVIIIILAFTLFFSSQAMGQFSLGSCTSPRETFKTYLKNSANVYIGFGTEVNKATKLQFDLSGEIAINYFPIDYLEIGTKFKTIIPAYKTTGNKAFFENNLYLRYHVARHSCMNTSLFGGASLERSHSAFSSKKEITDSYKLYSSLNLGIVTIPVKTLQIHIYEDFFLNRVFRTNLTLFWNFKTFKIRNKKE